MRTVCDEQSDAADMSDVLFSFTESQAAESRICWRARPVRDESVPGGLAVGTSCFRSS